MQPPRASRPRPARCAMATTPQARAVPRYKLGTNRISQHHPTLTNINRHLRRPLAVLGAKALVRILPAALHQPVQVRPRRAGWSPGWPERGIPSTSPRTTTRRPGGRAVQAGRRLLRGLPRAGARSGCARLTGCHASPSVQAQGPDEAPERHHPSQHKSVRGGTGRQDNQRERAASRHPRPSRPH
jgi:hypothetical protein